SRVIEYSCPTRPPCVRSAEPEYSMRQPREMLPLAKRLSVWLGCQLLKALRPAEYEYARLRFHGPEDWICGRVDASLAPRGSSAMGAGVPPPPTRCRSVKKEIERK